MLDFITLAQQCAPTVEPHTLAALVRVESGYNPYAIGVVGGQLARQPKNRAEAIATAMALEKEHWNFSVGMAQVNRYNLQKYNLTYEKAFEPCTNLQTGAQILETCYNRASVAFPVRQQALRAAFSCYYSGNFTGGFQTDRLNQPSYVQKILASAQISLPIPVISTVKDRKKSFIKNQPGYENPVVFDTVQPYLRKEDLLKSEQASVIVF